MPTAVHCCQHLSGSLGHLSPAQQTPLESTACVKEMIYPPTDARRIEGGYAEDSCGPRTQNVEQGERRTQRPLRILTREP
jgi:hypothetical protein